MQVHRRGKCTEDGRDECRNDESFLQSKILCKYNIQPTILAFAYLEVFLLNHIGVIHLSNVVHHGVRPAGQKLAYDPSTSNDD